MLRGFRSASAIALLALAVPTFAVAAGGKSITPSKNYIAPDAGDVNAIQATVLSTGFEAPFVVGPLEPQQGFSATGTNLPCYSVSTLNANTGAQHLRIIKDAAAGQGVSRVALSPTIVQPLNSPSQVKQMVYISGDGGADYDCFAQSPALALLSWRVKFSYSDDTGGGPGTIYILDNPGAGIEYVNTGVLWDKGVYRELKVQFDPGAGQIRYFYNGIQIYTGVIFGASKVDQIGWFMDNYQLGGESGGIDGVTWLDTPSDPVPTTPATWGKIKGQYR